MKWVAIAAPRPPITFQFFPFISLGVCVPVCSARCSLCVCVRARALCFVQTQFLRQNQVAATSFTPAASGQRSIVCCFYIRNTEISGASAQARSLFESTFDLSMNPSLSSSSSSKGNFISWEKSISFSLLLTLHLRRTVPYVQEMTSCYDHFEHIYSLLYCLHVASCAIGFSANAPARA